MMLIDTTILVDVLRDASGVNAERLLTLLGEEEVAFTRFTELEVLMGARDDAEWEGIQRYFLTKSMLEPNTEILGQFSEDLFRLASRGPDCAKHRRLLHRADCNRARFDAGPQRPRLRGNCQRKAAETSAPSARGVRAWVAIR